MIKKEKVNGIKYDTPEEVNFEFITTGIQWLCAIALVAVLGYFVYKNVMF